MRPAEGRAAITTAALVAALVMQTIPPAIAQTADQPSPAPSIAPTALPSPGPLPSVVLPTPTAPPPVFATPTPEPDFFPTIGGKSVQPGAAPPPVLASPAPGATVAPTPAPGEVLVTADAVYGNAGENGDATMLGHVHIKHADADIVADEARYYGKSKLIRATGNVHMVTASGDTATASALEYDTVADQVRMFQVAGQSSSIGFQGEQIHGYLFYRAASIAIDPDGHTFLYDGWVTTCDLRHVAYHFTGRQIEIKPGDRLIARRSALYLGKFLVGALGVLVLPLSDRSRRPSNYAPRIGYNGFYGFFIKNFLNFYRSANFYGTYHLDFFQKVGIGLGLDLFFQRRDGAGGGTLTVYNLRNNASQQQLTGTKNSFQANANYQQTLSPRLSASFQVGYFGTTGLFANIPATLNASLAVVHTGAHTTTNYQFTETKTGPSLAFSGIVNNTVAFSPVASESVSLAVQDVSNPSISPNPGNFSRAMVLQSLTHFTTPDFDADLTFDTTHGLSTVTSDTTETSEPVISFQRIPELVLHSRPFQLAKLRLPVDATLTIGHYDDEFDSVVTDRYEANVQLGSAFFRLGPSTDITASAGVRQDAYGTSDLQGSIGEQVTLHNFIGTHADNTLSYQALSVRGFTPLASYDRLSGFDQISEVFNVYNGSVYRFTASANYDFRNKFISPISYQLIAAPSAIASVSLGGSYDPNFSKFGPLSILLATPIGRDDFFQYEGSYDFKLHGLQGSNYFLTHTVNDCYQLRLAYRQPLREVDLSINLLAFPTRGVGFGINSNAPIIPQSFEF